MKRNGPKVATHAEFMAGLTAKKEAATAADPESYRKHTPCFRFRLMDIDPAFAWSFHHAGPDFGVLVTWLAALETMPWVQIEKDPHNHPWDPSDFTLKAAIARASELQIEELYQLKHGNKGRLFGVREGSAFLPVWWDPDHKIYETEKPKRSQR